MNTNEVAIYARFSTDRQSKDSATAQFAACTEYAERQGWAICARFADEGISGAAIGNRPDFVRMTKAIEAGEINVVLVVDLSRLSRSQGDLSKWIERVTFAGARIIGVQDGFDSQREEHEMIAGMSGIIGQQFRRMIAKRTHSALKMRADAERATGGRAFGFQTIVRADGTKGLEVVEQDAAIVRSIFAAWNEGQSCTSIASDLNARGVPSPGSSWDRKVRRAAGWMNSGVRSILKNEIYTGAVIWNRREFRKDPDSGVRTMRARPRSQWITKQNEELRIIDDATFQRAQQRTHLRANSNERLKSGGKPRYLLSGLMICADCGANLILSDARTYRCSSVVNGSCCTHTTRLRRDELEDKILGPIRVGLKDPARAARTARQVEEGFARWIAQKAARVRSAPRELQELNARLVRLRARLAAGDPDMEPDELAATITKVEGKRAELLAAQPAAKATAKIHAIVPKATAMYREAIDAGMSGNLRAAARARAMLRAYVGPIMVSTDPQGRTWADHKLRPAVLVKGLAGTDGSGGAKRARH